MWERKFYGAYLAYKTKKGSINMVKLNNEVTLDIKLNTEDLIKDLKKVQREAKKATQAIKEYDASSKKENEINTLLDLAGKYGFLLTATDDMSRGIGKTHALIKKAIKENLVILVGNPAGLDYLRREYKYENITSPRKLDGIKGKRFNGFLVDDLVTNVEIAKFADFTELEFKGGFSISQYYLQKQQYDY